MSGKAVKPKERLKIFTMAQLRKGGGSVMGKWVEKVIQGVEFELGGGGKKIGKKNRRYLI